MEPDSGFRNSSTMQNSLESMLWQRELGSPISPKVNELHLSVQPIDENLPFCLGVVRFIPQILRS